VAKPLEGEVVKPQPAQREPETPQERAIVRCLALGYSLRETARLTRVSLSTVTRKAAVLHDAIERIRENVPREIERQVYGNLALALDVERLVLSGELEADDKRAQAAALRVKRWEDKLFFVDRETPPPGAQAAIEAPAEQLQLTEGGTA
jgi:hypothetical protein